MTCWIGATMVSLVGGDEYPDMGYLDPRYEVWDSWSRVQIDPIPREPRSNGVLSHRTTFKWGALPQNHVQMGYLRGARTPLEGVKYPKIAIFGTLHGHPK